MRRRNSDPMVSLSICQLGHVALNGSLAKSPKHLAAIRGNITEKDGLHPGME